jgi:S-adenosylmethionine hydrolase
VAGSWISFLSDYGVTDTRVAMCHGVIARAAPEARVIDVCHAVEPNDAAHAAMLLAGVVGYLPTAVHLATVEADDQVDVPAGADVEPSRRRGGARGVVARTADGSTFVGPDNGLGSQAWEMLGGVVAAHEIADADLGPTRRTVVSRGRDVYAPVAARLAGGLPLAEVGPPIAPGDLIRLRPRGCAVDDDHIHGEVVSVDHFGNLALNATRTDLEAIGVLLGDPLELRVAGRARTARFTHGLAQVPPGAIAVSEDALRHIMITVNRGRAADRLRAGRGAPVVLARTPRTQPAPQSLPWTPS